MFDAKALLSFKFIMLLPSVSNTFTALPIPTIPALSNNELTFKTYLALTMVKFKGVHIHFIQFLP